MIEEGPSRRDSVSYSSHPLRSESPITIFNDNRKLRSESSPIPTTGCGTSTSLECNPRQRPSQNEEDQSEVVKEFEEKGSRLYESGWLKDDAKGIEERATGLLNRAEQGIAGLFNRRHVVEGAHQRQPCLTRAHVDIQGGGGVESVLSHDEVPSGVIASASGRAPGLRFRAGPRVADPEATDRTRSPIANHQDKMEFGESSLESNAQETALSLLASAHLTCQRHPPSPPLPTSRKKDVPIRNLRNISPASSLTGGTLASVPLGIQAKYYKMDKSVAVIDANLSGSEEAQRMGGFALSHIVHGANGVGFTMDVEGRRLPGHPTPAWMFHRIQANIKQNASSTPGTQWLTLSPSAPRALAYRVQCVDGSSQGFRCRV
ncbi:hypothetical protein BKA70DRAFT_1428657 [Coprinopsis sp. MPI-PUGE-AT-0042]|nr:hypothetical protein BKA70DRAFT_1428657 [Coprinopsis sp. MPI-PUGE-AT-0042]